MHHVLSAVFTGVTHLIYVDVEIYMSQIISIYNHLFQVLSNSAVFVAFIYVFVL